MHFILKMDFTGAGLCLNLYFRGTDTNTMHKTVASPHISLQEVVHARLGHFL